MVKYECEIFGRKCVVTLDDKALQEACSEYDLDPDTTTGLYIHAERKIIVSTAQDPIEVVQTILHELLHAIGHITGHHMLGHSTPKNEAIVNVIADGLRDALKSNELYILLGGLLGHIKRLKEVRNGEKNFGNCVESN